MSLFKWYGAKEFESDMDGIDGSLFWNTDSWNVLPV
jgi:hypothetical protein